MCFSRQWEAKFAWFAPTDVGAKILPTLSELAAGGQTRELPRKRSSRLRTSRVEKAYWRVLFLSFYNQLRDVSRHLLVVVKFHTIRRSALGQRA